MAGQNYTLLVTGGTGLVGTELKKLMPQGVYVSSKDYDLTREVDVIRMFKDVQPDIVVHLAARVGSLLDNMKHLVEYFDDNVLMNTLVLREAYRNNVDRFIGILSTCIYPDKVKRYPMKEEDIHAGPPHKDIFSYSYAKRCLAVQIEAYNRQYGTRYHYLIPCNLYGNFDANHSERSHYVNALIRKIYIANKNGDKEIVLFGDGTPLRQFMHARDLARAIYLCIDKDVRENMNVAIESNLSVHEIALTALKACNSEHLAITYDASKPNGQFRKDVSIQKFRKFFPDFNFTTLHDGIKSVYENLGEDCYHD